jgi:hypothetical protein
MISERHSVINKKMLQDEWRVIEMRIKKLSKTFSDMISAFFDAFLLAEEG